MFYGARETAGATAPRKRKAAKRHIPKGKCIRVRTPGGMRKLCRLKNGKVRWSR